jgi:sugar phosphate isomerase/epimerase
MDKPAIPRSSLNQIPASFATVSVGTPKDPLELKLKAISAAGFQAIELGFPDLLSFASSHFQKEISDHDFNSLCEAGKGVRKLCEKYKLGVMMLQPFSNFEGWPEGSKEREDAFERAKGWIEIMKVVGTDTLQVHPQSPYHQTNPINTAFRSGPPTPLQSQRIHPRQLGIFANSPTSSPPTHSA